jgi:glucose-1-phosphate adenylyltransferase
MQKRGHYERDTLAVVMAGGMGERLRPLTDVRTKPAVPFGGIYRIIDFTLSNCLNSGLHRILVLTQYKSHSLSTHLKTGWSFLSRRLDEFIDEIPAQKQLGESWYLGTADAIRQNMRLIEQSTPRLVLILSGDHIYKMDYRLLCGFHVARGGCLSVAAIRVPIELARGRYGVLVVDDHWRVVGFEEKPAEPRTIPGTDECLASMGIYVGELAQLQRCLEGDHADFGQHLIPALVAEGERVYAFDFTTRNRIAEHVYVVSEGRRTKLRRDNCPDSSYWRDVGELDAYWQANMDLVEAEPMFNLYGELWPFFNSPIHFPPSKFVHEAPGRIGAAVNSIVADGVIVSGATVRNSVLGPGLYVHSYATVERSVLMGGGMRHGIWAETTIGRHCRIRNAIIDKVVTVREGTVIGYDRAQDEARGLTTQTIGETEDYLVVVPRDAVI